MPRLRHNDDGVDADDPCGTCGHLRSAHVSKALATDGRVCLGLRFDPMGPATPCICQWFVKGTRKPKPPPKQTVSMRLTWLGPHPEVGDFMMSAQKPKWGYQVVSVDPNDTGTVLEIEAKRVPASEVPQTAKVHPLRWQSREPKSKQNNRGWG